MANHPGGRWWEVVERCGVVVVRCVVGGVVQVAGAGNPGGSSGMGVWWSQTNGGITQVVVAGTRQDRPMVVAGRQWCAAAAGEPNPGRTQCRAGSVVVQCRCRQAGSSSGSGGWQAGSRCNPGTHVQAGSRQVCGSAAAGELRTSRQAAVAGRKRSSMQ